MVKNKNEVFKELAGIVDEYSFFVGHDKNDLQRKNEGNALEEIAEKMLQDRDYIFTPTKLILKENIKKGILPTARRTATTLKWRIRRGQLGLKPITQQTRDNRKIRKNTPPLFDTGFLTRYIIGKARKRKKGI